MDFFIGMLAGIIGALALILALWALLNIAAARKWKWAERFMPDADHQEYD